MILTKANVFINILAGTGVITGVMVGGAIPDVAEAAKGAGFMDWLNYYSDALGVMFAGITCIGFIGFNVWRISRKDK